MWRSQESTQMSPSRTDSATYSKRSFTRPSSSSSAPMNFLKRFIPGQRKGRPMSGDGDAGQNISHFEDLPPEIQALLHNDPNAMQNLRSGNGKIKVIFDPRPASDDEDDIQAALQASLRGPSPPPPSVNPAITRFFVRGCLDYSNSIPDGFYAVFGEFPEVADKGCLPMLSQLMMCEQIIEGRDVILFDLTSDPALEDFKQQVIDSMPQVAGATLVNKVAWVVQLVAARLGGARSDEALKSAYTAHSIEVQRRNGSVVIPVGQLSVGLSRHRAMLAKLALDWLNIRTCILPSETSHAYTLLVREPFSSIEGGTGGAVELEINITESPGEILRRITGRIAASTSSSIGCGVSPYGGGPAGVGPWQIANVKADKAAIMSASSPPIASFLRSASPQLSAASGDGFSGALVPPLHVAQVLPRGAGLSAAGVRLPAVVSSSTVASSSHGDLAVPYENIYSHRNGTLAFVHQVTGLRSEHTAHRIITAVKPPSEDAAAAAPAVLGFSTAVLANGRANPFNGAPKLPPSVGPLRWPFSHPELLGSAFRPGRGARRAASAAKLRDSAAASSSSGRPPSLVLGKSDSFVTNGASGPVRLRVAEDIIVADSAVHLPRLRPLSPPAPGVVQRRNGHYKCQPAPKRLSNGLASVFDGVGAGTVPPDPLSARHLPERASPVPIAAAHAATATVRPDMAPSPFNDDDSNGGAAPAPGTSSAHPSTRFSGLVSSAGGEDLPWWGESSRASEPSRASSRVASGTAKGDALSPHASRLISDAARRPLAPSIDEDTVPSRSFGHGRGEGLVALRPAAAHASDAEMTDGLRRLAGQSRVSASLDEAPRLASLGGAFADTFSDSSQRRLCSSSADMDDGSRRPMMATLGGAFADSDEDDTPVGSVCGDNSRRQPIMASLGGAFGDSDDDSWGEPRPNELLFGDELNRGLRPRTSEASARAAEELTRAADSGVNRNARPAGPVKSRSAGLPRAADDSGNAYPRSASAGAPRDEAGGGSNAVVHVPVMGFLGGAFGGEIESDGDGEPVLPVSSIEAGPMLSRPDGEDATSPPASKAVFGSVAGIFNAYDTSAVDQAPQSHDTAERTYNKCSSVPVGAQMFPSMQIALHRKVDSVVSEPAELPSPEAGSPSQNPGALHPPTSPAAAAMAAAALNLGGAPTDSSSFAISQVLSATSSMHSVGLGDHSSSMVIPGGGLRSLLENQPTQMMEKLFHMWIRAADITMTPEVIGRGSYGQVMLAKFRTERCAVKQIICETKAEYRASMQEMLLMQELQFDKIVRFFGAIKHSPQCLWICMEYMPFSDLRKILHSPKHRSECRFSETLLTLARRLKWAKDVVAALDLLHSRCVVHRDLKPGNILISNKYDAVLSDFGLSRVRAAQQSRLQASGPGTVSYAAPEALSNNQVSPASDMFSFGCVLWELLSLKEPWAELSGNAFQVMHKIVYEKEHLRIEDVPRDVHENVPGVIEVLELCFSYDPSLRPAAERVYEVLDAAIESL